ncbi:MAG TPA: alpha/beta fold hydrolase [Gemmatimonadaceae bacterium]|nr:alpha/beta fold hydrolase [Gemmatimonadaceae bacterium]
MKRGKSPLDLPGVVKSSRDIAGGHQVTLELEAEREHVPAILLLPDGERESRPGALLLHGFTSRKERMAEGIGRALLARGIATLSIDLPLHGAREGSIDELSLRNPLQLIGAWRLALREVSLSLDYLTQLAVIDTRRLALVGYSLGSFLSVAAAVDDDRVRAMVLASGGDLPERTPFAALVRAAADPLRAVRKFAGRPLLMVNGRFDRTVTSAQAERLYEAAREPKEIHWYQGGHWPPPSEIDFAAEWLSARLGEVPSASRHRAKSVGAD